MTITYTIFLSAIIVLYLIAGGYWVYTLYVGAPFYPSNKKAIKTITKFISKELKSQNVLELGSGDGRVANAIANLGVQVTAIELSPWLTIIHRANNLLGNVKNVDIKNGNFLKYKFSDYDLVITYLFPGIMSKLETKLFKELKKDSFIISNTFEFKNHKPYKKLDNKIIIYKV